MRKTFLLTCLMIFCCSVMAEKIDRKAVVRRNNPHVTKLDPLSSLTVGNGTFAFTVDATGLQTFPKFYEKGVPLGTMSDWGWHMFPNTEKYKMEDVLANHDFHRGHDQELYAVQFKQEGRQKDACNYLRANPHRLQLGYVGMMLDDEKKMTDIDQTLDMWTGKVDSKFKYNGSKFHVQTVCDPKEDLIASHIDGPQDSVGIRIYVPYPSGKGFDTGVDWANGNKVDITLYNQPNGQNTAIVRISIDKTLYYIDIAWTGKAKLNASKGFITLKSKGTSLDFYCRFHMLTPKSIMAGDGEFFPCPFNDFVMASAGRWADFWLNGGFVDFGHVKDSRAKELERRVILSQYLMGTQECGATPPQETGLTYNSWFGKYHLEMIWWHQAWMPMWNHPEYLDKSLDWYHLVMPIAHKIAMRQGFKGVRWMKMTDPSGIEAPSNVGSFLIWQQPHPIYLAELLYRCSANKSGVIDKYKDIVQKTADFMADFAEYDSVNNRYVLRGCIPAQETLKADSTVNPPFELSYWLTTLQIAQQWRERCGVERKKGWDDIIEKLSPLAYNEDKLYLAAETATNTYTDRRFTSDHPALLGALGMMPENKLVDKKIMANTLDWIWKNWNWNKTWGWDYPMVAMTCARLGQKSRAVDALLMDKRTNTYLVNGHNYQDDRLRVYMPGNGGLLTAVGMMCAGWDGNTKNHPGFPEDWDVRFEDIYPMP